MIDDPTDAGPPHDPYGVGGGGASPRSDAQKPPVRQRGWYSLVLALIGFVTCLVATLLFAIAAVGSGSPGVAYAICVAVVLLLFLVRQRKGPAPELSAVVAGATVALVIVGGCMAVTRMFSGV